VSLYFQISSYHRLLRGRPYDNKMSAVRGVCPVHTFCGQRGCSSDVDICIFWHQNFGFFKIYGVPAQTRRLSQCEYFADKGGVNFSRFCADVFYGRSLSLFCEESIHQKHRQNCMLVLFTITLFPCPFLAKLQSCLFILLLS